MSNNTILNKEFLEEGVILQTPEGFFVAAGPLGYHDHVHPTKPCVYAPLFFNANKTFIHPNQWSFVKREELLSFFTFYQEKHFSPHWQEPNYNNFKEMFNHFQKSSKSGDLKKVVPVVFFKNSMPLTITKRAFLIKNMLQKKEGFIYGYWNSKEGMVGCTPEYLFEQKNSNLYTMALAGTSKKNDKSFCSDKKEIQEHQLVVEDILSRWKGFLYQISQRYLQYFGDIQHFRTDIKIDGAGNLSFLNLIQKMHPTSALGGYPRTEALLWLRAHNREDRQRHGAPFAVCFSKEKSFCLVAIRNIQWKGSSIFLGSGCGLTQLSVLDKEWEELRLKKQSVISLLWM